MFKNSLLEHKKRYNVCKRKRKGKYKIKKIRIKLNKSSISKPDISKVIDLVRARFDLVIAKITPAKLQKWFSKQGKRKSAVNFGAVSMILLVVFVLINVAHASDLLDDWTFSNANDYTYDSATTEVSGNSVRLKAQEYATDANTSALYHLNESSGTSAADNSGNSNTGTTQNSPTWGAGRLNNGLALNGTNQYLSAPSSASLDLSQKNTLEANFKMSSTLSAESHVTDQPLVDKGSYKLYLDHSTGKLTYELNNPTARSWNSVNGSGLPSSSPSPIQIVPSGTDQYVYNSDNKIWKRSGGSWTNIATGPTTSNYASYGGVFPNNPTPIGMAISGNTLYAVQNSLYYFVFGGTTYQGDVGFIWSCDLSVGCSSWTATFSTGWSGLLTINTAFTGGSSGGSYADSVVLIGSDLFIRSSLVAGAIFKCPSGGGCSSVTVAAGYNNIPSIVTDGTYLYTGMGNLGSDGDVYRCTTAISCTKIGGDGLIYNATGWANSTYEIVNTLTIMGGNLYVGLGSGANDDEVWMGTGITGTPTWTKIGGDGINSGWTGLSNVNSLANDGTNVYAKMSGSANVYKWNGSTWAALSWAWINTARNSLYYTNSTMFSFNNSDISTLDTSTGVDTIIAGHHINGTWDAANYSAINYTTEYNGSLYAAVKGTNASDGKDYESSVWRIDNPGGSATWTRVGGSYISSSFSTVTNFQSLFVYNNKLCVLGAFSSTTDTAIYCYNGSVWNQLATHTNLGNLNATNVYPGVYQGNLYVLVSTGDTPTVRVYNGSTWSTSATFGSQTHGSLVPYNGKLYAFISGSGGGYASFDGSSWSSVTGVASIQFIPSVWSIVAGGKIYFDCTGGTAICETDGTTTTSYTGAGALNCNYVTGSPPPYQAYFAGNIYMSCSSNDSTSAFDVVAHTFTSLANGYESYFSAAGSLYSSNGTTLYAQSNPTVQSTTTSWSSSSWYHLAATYDGEFLKLYVNGTLQGSTTLAMSLPSTTQPLYIGRAYGSHEPVTGDAYFAGTIDEVRISNTNRTSFTAVPYVATTQTVSIANAIRLSGVWHWDTFTTNETTNGGSINYQLSDDNGVTWKYYNAGSWQAAASTSNANSAAVVNTNIATFPVTFAGLKWRAILLGDGTQQVTLSSVSVASTSDAVAPSANASSITAKKIAGGDNLAAGGWTNGATPYFSWTAGADAGSGVKGYCLYLGTSSTGDPVTTKGLLGTSPTTTGGYCQFIVSGTTLDTATSGYLASSLTTSNSNYYLNVKAIDNAGNVYGTNAQFAFRFDNTPPANPAYISAPSGFVASKAVTLSWPTAGGDAASDANSGLAGLQYKINSSSWYGDLHLGSQDATDLLTNDGSYLTVDPPDFANINEGVNTVYFRTWDAAGNYTTSYATAAIKINTTGAPSEPQNLVATPASSSSNSFAFSWSAPSTYNGTDTNIVYCYTVNTQPAAGTCTWTQPGVTSLAAGPYATQPGANTFYVVAKDESGAVNYSTYASAAFTANTTAPGIPVNTSISDVSIRSTSNWRLAITWETPASVGSGVASYKIHRSVNGTTYVEVGSSSSPSYVDGSLSQQLYYYKIKACDSTSNCGAFGTVVSATPTGKFTSAAGITAQPTVSGVSSHKATVRWSTDRESDSRVALGIKSGTYSANEIITNDQVTDHQIELDNLSAGTTYFAKVKWTDVDGNTGISSEFSFTTTGAPEVSEVSAQNVNINSAVIQFTIQNATKAKLYFGNTDSFGSLQVVNTATTESAYSVSLTGLSDGTKYFYKINPVDSDGFEYNTNVYSFSTPARPHIENLTFQPIEGEPTSTQKVNWTTNVAASSQISYGIEGKKSTEIVSSELVTTHEIIIRGLEDNSAYFLIASSRDGNGNVATSDRQTFRTALDTRPPKVSDVNIETTIRGIGTDARGQVIVTWKTDEPSSSQVLFNEGTVVSESSNRSSDDSSQVVEHVVVLSDLSTSKVYSMQVLSKDKAGNVGTSESQTTIIGRASESVLTIIINTLSRIFSWVSN